MYAYLDQNKDQLNTTDYSEELNSLKDILQKVNELVP